MPARATMVFRRGYEFAAKVRVPRKRRPEYQPLVASERLRREQER